MLGSQYAFNPEYEKNIVENKIIIFEPQEEYVYILGEVEISIFEKLNGSRSLKEVINELEKEYAVNDIENDVVEFVRQLTEKGILVCL